MKVDRQRFIVKYTLLTLIIGLGVYFVFPFYAPITVGLIFGTVLQPFHRKLRGYGMGNTLSGTLIVVLFSVMVLVPTSLLVIEGSDALVKLLQNTTIGTDTMNLLRERDFRFLPDSVRNLFQKVGLTAESIRTGLMALGSWVFGVLKNFIQQLPEIAFAILIIVLTVFFVLVNKSDIKSYIYRSSPLSEARMDALSEAFRKSCNTVVFTIFIGGLVQASIFSIAAILLGTGQVFVIGFSVFLLSFFPVFGTAPASLALSLGYFMAGQTGMGIGWLVVGIIAGVSDNIVKPLLVSSSVDIHPFFGLLMVVGSVVTMGIAGLFIGPLIAGLLITCVPILMDVDERSRPPSKSEKQPAVA